MSIITYIKKKQKHYHTKGFTLIEIIIVLVVLSILIVALIPKLNAVSSRARDVARKSHLKQIASAIDVYQVDFGGLTGLQLISWTRDLQVPLVNGGYITSLPVDPNTTWTRSGVTFGGFVVPSTGGTYGFAAVVRDGALKTFVMMAKVEVLTNANWVYNDITTAGRIAPGMGRTSFVPACTSVVRSNTGGVNQNSLVQGSGCYITQAAYDLDNDTNQRYLYAQ